MSREQLVPYEKAVVQRISYLAKCDVHDDNYNEDQVINATADLVAAVKNLSAQATHLVSLSPDHHTTATFYQHRDKLHNDTRAFVANLKDCGDNPGSLKIDRNTFLTQLKSLAQSTKAVIDAINALYPVVLVDPKTLTEDDLAEEHDEVPRCTGCQLPIEKNASTLKYAETLWHPACFVCSKCTKPIESAQFLILEAKPVCRSCSPKCAKCGLSVITDCVTALRKHFHASCFTCGGCGVVIQNISQFYRKNGRPCCAVCVSRNSVFDHISSNTRSGIYFDDDTEETQARSPVYRASQQPGSSSVERESFMSEDGSDKASQISSTLDTPTASARPIATSRPLSHSPSNPRCLLGVLSREEGITLLIQFCMEDYSIEKIFFYLDVEQFKVVSVTDQELADYAKSIHRKYIFQDAEMNLKLPEDMTKQLEAKLENNQISRNLFDAAEKLVYEDLEKDIFPRFFYSLAGKKYLAKVMEEERMQQLAFNSGVMRITAGSVNKKPAEKEKPVVTKIRSSLNVIDESTTIEISNFEKRYEKQKYYVYEITVTKMGVDGTSESMFVFRRYSEFFQLHEALNKLFPDAPFPPFPPKIFIRRSSVKSVAISRMQDLEYYLKGIISMKDVMHSEVLANFLKPTEDDLQNFWFNKRMSQFSNHFSSKYH